MRTLRFIQDTTAQSLFMTGASITSVRPVRQYRIFVDPGIVPYPGVNYTFKDGSTCVCSASTATTCMGLATFKNDTVPGFQTGCYMLSALINSTLEVFHNQTFIDMLSGSSGYFQKLNSSNSSLKVEVLLSQMFVKSWSNSTSYEEYFQSCTPDSCQYTITQHYNFWAIILLLIGLFGGLSSVLRIISPILIVKVWPIILKVIFRQQVRATQIDTVENIPVTSMSTRMKSFFQLIKRKLIELNLFPSIPPSQDAAVLRQERHQTRTYIIFLLTSSLILTVFISIKPYTYSETVKLPSSDDFKELYEKHSSTLDCPCSQTTLEYNQFITDIKPKYHQICSSEFVTSRWIDVQFVKSPVKEFLVNDIRYQSKIHFQLLSTLCRIANQTVEENLKSFYQTNLITPQVFNRSSFQTQVNLMLDQFESTVPETYQRTLQLIQANSEINQFIVPLNSEFRIARDANYETYPELNQVQHNKIGRPFCEAHLPCKCIVLSPNECVEMTIISYGTRATQIPGMFQSVFPLRSVLISSLECFYNDTCLSQITRFIDPFMSPTNFSTLQLSSSNETEYDKIDKLVDKIFIQSWKNQSSYESYFNQCRPLTCQYTYQSGFNIIYIITTIIGLLGGLNTALQLFIPPLVKFLPRIWKNTIHRKRNNTAPAVQTVSIKPAFHDRLRILTEFTKKQMVELNLFPTITPTQDKKILRRSRRINRIYLFLLILSIFILGVYTYLTQETITKTEPSPVLSKYAELLKEYPFTLQCPCSHVAMKYETFITQIEPEYHPICSSTFVSPEWIDALFYTGPFSNENFVDDDFRFWIKDQFETVSKICSLSKTILNTSISKWRQTDFFTAHIISPTEFEIQIKQLIEEFKRKTANQFFQTFKLIQASNHANQLATTRSSNWKFVSDLAYDLKRDVTDIFELIKMQDEFQMLTQPQTYDEDNCSCAKRPSCSKYSSFPIRTSNKSLKQTLPGFRTGCLPLDALFQSTFSCLYNQTCLNLMRAAIYYSKPIPAKIFTDSSSPSSRNITIEAYLRKLFVTKWSENASFDLYFNECAPESCRYLYTFTFNALFFITTIIALFGGLVHGLHFAVNCVATVVMKLYDHRKRNQVTAYSGQPSVATVNLEDDQTLEIAPIPETTTVHTTITLVQQEKKSATKRKDRILMICLSLLTIAAIIIVSFKWLRNENTTHVSTHTPTVTMTANTMITQTVPTNSCYMTFLNPPVAYSVGFGSKSLVIADFNNDSIQDLAVTNCDNNTISVLFGKGDGTFSMQEMYSTGDKTCPWGITISDFNNDTFLDLAVTLSTPIQVAIFFGIASNGSFTTTPHTFIVNRFMDNIFNVIEASDLSGDGFTDMIIASKHKYAGTTFIYILINSGDGYLYKETTVPSLQEIRDVDSIVIGDFDNDGKENDISVCTLKDKVKTVFSYSYVEHPIFIEMPLIAENHMYAEPQSLIQGRFNDDEFADLAVISSNSDTLQVLLAYEDRKFIQHIYSVESYPTSVARIYFNNDSIDDLAVLTCNQTVNIYLGTKLGIFDENIISFHFGESNNNSSECVHTLKVADFNQDGIDDLIFIDSGTQTVKIVLGTICDEHIYHDNRSRATH